MNGLIMAAQLIAGLSILVILHELGHFLAARAFGIKVEKFYLFFDAWGFKLFSFKVGDTEYGLGWLPLGGYVKIAGMIDESMDTEQLKQPAQEWEFRSKPAWQRLIVMLGGVTVNVILGAFIFWMLTFSYGDNYIPNAEAKYGIVAYDLAQEIGLKTGDKVMAINGKPLEKYSDLWSTEIVLGSGVLDVFRDNETIKIRIPSNFIEKISDKGRSNYIDDLPRTLAVIDSIIPNNNAEKAGLKKGDHLIAVGHTSVMYMDELRVFLQNNKSKEINFKVLRGTDTVAIPTQVSEDGTIGFAPKIEFSMKHIDYGFFEALPIGINKAWTTLTDNVKGLAKVVKGEVKATKAIQGPIGIASIYGSTFNWIKFWTLTGVLSMILAFMNILPIPALDGGHSVFLLIEMAIGRPLSDKFMERAQMVGFFILIALMVFAFGNDLWKLFVK
ncbi:MAG: RIP metalloprotease RseP [Sphingobacteriales bacterium]|nr:RIP metalloprotease RseP [Sphingobacteriales bacterium]